MTSSGNAIANMVLASLLLVGCSSPTRSAAVQQTPPAPSSAPPTLTVPPGPVPASVQQLCDSLPWPRPIPEVAGELVDGVTTGSLDCWSDNLKLIAADGHDVAASTDDLQKGRSFRITSVSPPPGTMAGRDDTITVHGTVVEATELVSLPAESFPCRWLTADEVANAVGVQTVTEDPAGDKAGQVEPFCSYLVGNSSLTSQLFSSAALPVDAGHMFAFYTAGKPDESFIAIDGFPGPTRCVSTKVGSDAAPSHALWALLEGNRIYWLAAGLRDVPCQTLTTLAHKAIQRIGT